MKTTSWKQWIVLVCLAATAAVAQAQDKKAIVIDGSHWMNASTLERRAFLVGVGNMIAAETAYAKRHNREPPPAASLITKSVHDLKLPEIEDRITRWYEANPARRNVPVMGVLWSELVKPKR